MSKKKQPTTPKKKPVKKEAVNIPDPDALPVSRELPLHTAQLASLQAQLTPQLEKLVQSGHYSICLFHLNGSTINLYRQNKEMFVEDFATLVNLLKEDLEEEREKRKNPT